MPVTSKAENDQEYIDYLSRIGEDNDLYYDIKIKAAQLLMDNVDNTFVTPVFNGSASLRDAAGQLIENVAKSIRRKETVDDIYMENLYEKVISLYRLNLESKGGGFSSEKAELGQLPKTAVTLLTGLGATWVLMGLYYIITLKKNSKK